MYNKNTGAYGRFLLSLMDILFYAFLVFREYGPITRFHLKEGEVVRGLIRLAVALARLQCSVISHK